MGLKLDIDDPYRILASMLVGYSRPSEVVRTLTDDEYLEMLVRKETRQVELAGWFLDCIVSDLLEKRRRMELVAELDKLAEYLYSCLDKKRLRDEILTALGNSGIQLVDCGKGVFRFDIVEPNPEVGPVNEP